MFWTWYKHLPFCSWKMLSLKIGGKKREDHYVIYLITYFTPKQTTESNLWVWVSLYANVLLINIIRTSDTFNLIWKKRIMPDIVYFLFCLFVSLRSLVLERNLFLQYLKIHVQHLFLTVQVQTTLGCTLAAISMTTGTITITCPPSCPSLAFSLFFFSPAIILSLAFSNYSQNHLSGSGLSF